MLSIFLNFLGGLIFLFRTRPAGCWIGRILIAFSIITLLRIGTIYLFVWFRELGSVLIFLGIATNYSPFVVIGLIIELAGFPSFFLAYLIFYRKKEWSTTDFSLLYLISIFKIPYAIYFVSLHNIIVPYIYLLIAIVILHSLILVFMKSNLIILLVANSFITRTIAIFIGIIDESLSCFIIIFYSWGRLFLFGLRHYDNFSLPVSLFSLWSIINLGVIFKFFSLKGWGALLLVDFIIWPILFLCWCWLKYFIRSTTTLSFDTKTTVIISLFFLIACYFFI